MINCDCTHEISPNAAKASRRVCVSISGLKSPTKMWKCSAKKKKVKIEDETQSLNLMHTLKVGLSIFLSIRYNLEAIVERYCSKLFKVDVEPSQIALKLQRNKSSEFNS